RVRSHELIQVADLVDRSIWRLETPVFRLHVTCAASRQRADLCSGDSERLMRRYCRPLLWQAIPGSIVRTAIGARIGGVAVNSAALNDSRDRGPGFRRDLIIVLAPIDSSPVSDLAH